MVVDSSAIVAMLLREPSAIELAMKLESAAVVLVGAPTVAEATIVLSTKNKKNYAPFVRDLLESCAAVVVDFDQRHADVAADAYSRFGKGQHKSALNYGDCLSYAIAKVAGQPLLFTGSDFAHTDIEVA